MSRRSAYITAVLVQSGVAVEVEVEGHAVTVSVHVSIAVVPIVAVTVTAGAVTVSVHVSMTVVGVQVGLAVTVDGGSVTVDGGAVNVSVHVSITVVLVVAVTVEGDAVTVSVHVSMTVVGVQVGFAVTVIGGSVTVDGVAVIVSVDVSITVVELVAVTVGGQLVSDVVVSHGEVVVMVVAVLVSHPHIVVVLVMVGVAVPSTQKLAGILGTMAAFPSTGLPTPTEVLSLATGAATPKRALLKTAARAIAQRFTDHLVLFDACVGDAMERRRVHASVRFLVWGSDTTKSRVCGSAPVALRWPRSWR